MIRSKYLKCLIRHCAVAFLPWISSSLPCCVGSHHEGWFFPLFFSQASWIKHRQLNVEIEWPFCENPSINDQMTEKLPTKNGLSFLQASNKPWNQPSSTKKGFSKKNNVCSSTGVIELDILWGSNLQRNGHFEGFPNSFKIVQCLGWFLYNEIKDRAPKWDVKNPVNNRINYQPQLASFPGFLVAINSIITQTQPRHQQPGPDKKDWV